MGGCRLIDFMAEFWLFYLFIYLLLEREEQQGGAEKPEFHANLETLETFNKSIEMIKSHG